VARLIGNRLVAMVPMLIGLSLIAFLLIHLSPTDPARLILGDANEEAVAELRDELGLNRPLHVQYGAWLGAAIQGDLGDSLFNSRPVLKLIFNRLPITVSLAGGALVLSSLMGIALGIVAGTKQRGMVDRSILALASLGTAVPGFWLALLLTLLFGLSLGWFPVIGYTPLTENPFQWARHMVLPIVALSVRPASVIARQTRNSMAEVLGSDYIQAIRARGLSRRAIVSRYAVRNGLVPVVSTIGVQATTILVVSFVIERVFGFPGVGSLVVDAVIRSDFPVVQGTLLVLGAIAIFTQLFVDVGYGLINPRARPQ
jgi:peptide/nickel transport system permease protein